jgi:hypothetical protein
MISSLLRLASLACIAVLVISFGAFASEQAGHGSKATVAKIAAADASTDAPAPEAQIDEASPDLRTERARERRHGALREKIDDVDDALLSPFKGIAGNGSIWEQRIVEGLLAFLVFGVGLGFLARYAATRGV